MTALRHNVEPLAVPPLKAARRIGLTLAEFKLKLPELLAHKFPPPNPVTGNYFLPAIDRWLENPAGENPQLSERAPSTTALDARSVVQDRVARAARWAR